MSPKYTAKELPLRFWSKVKLPDLIGTDECWEWQASVNQSGYGTVNLVGFYLAHRLAWYLCCGSIPEGLLVCHSCDNRLCCNPSHLWLGTNDDNIADMVNKGRANSPKGDDHWTRKSPENLRRGDNHPARYIPGWRAGENNGRAILDWDTVAEIRRKYEYRTHSYTRLAKEYGVGKSTITNIIKGNTWRK